MRVLDVRKDKKQTHWSLTFLEIKRARIFISLFDNFTALLMRANKQLECKKLVGTNTKKWKIKFRKEIFLQTPKKKTF